MKLLYNHVIMLIISHLFDFLEQRTPRLHGAKGPKLGGRERNVQLPLVLSLAARQRCWRPVMAVPETRYGAI